VISPGITFSIIRRLARCPWLLVSRPRGNPAGADHVSSGHERGVLDLGLIDEDVRVRVRRHREVALADELADPRPRDAAQVHEADPTVTQIVLG
jgi:hypothetical protein